MKSCFLGVDIGGTKSHALLTDQEGKLLGFGIAGTGNHESVGYEGLKAVLRQMVNDALAQAGCTHADIAGAGFGLCGYDWESERAAHLDAVGVLELSAPVEIVNDAVLGLVAGTSQGWGVSVIAGTSCNCWGRDATGRYGHVIGMGQMVGEGAGGSEMVRHALWQIAYAFTQFGPPTALTERFAQAAGLDSAAALLEAYTEGHLHFDARHAPLVFETAAAGDAVAQGVIRWAGEALGDLAIAVIRQLKLHAQAFELVQAGSLYKGSPLLGEAMQARIHQEAPHARLVRLTAPPVLGGVLLGMEQAGCSPLQIAQVRQRLMHQPLIEEVAQ